MRNKILIAMLTILLLTTTTWSQATNYNIFARPTADWFSGQESVRNIPLQWMRAIDPMVAAGSGAGGTGDNFYVDSGLTVAGDGSSWSNAVATWDAAVALCADNNGDNIHIAPGHAETFSTDASLDNDSVDLDVIGVTSIGYGTGTDRPTFTYADVDNEVVVAALNNTITNVVFQPGVANVVHAVEFEADSDGSILINCEFLSGSTDAFEFVDAIQPAAAADDLTICYNNVTETTAGAVSWLDLSGGVVDNIAVYGNVIYGDYSTGTVDSTGRAGTLGYYGFNTITNLSAGDAAFYFDSAATGVMEFNRIYTDAEATAIDPGSMACFENYVTTTTDVSGMITPVYDDGTTQLNATTVTAIAAGVAGTNFYGVATGTTNTTTTTDSAMTGFHDEQFTTDYVLIVTHDAAGAQGAPEGEIVDIENYVASTGAFTHAALTAATTAGDRFLIVRDESFNLLSLVASTGNYPTGVLDDSVLAYILGKGATASASTYVNTTDSLEMISDKLGAFAGTAGAGANESILADIALIQTDLGTIEADTEAIDTAAELQALAGTADVNTVGITSTPVAQTLADTLHKDGSFTFDNTTDALEAIADEAEYSMTVTRTKGGGIDLVSGTNNLFVVSGPVEVTVLTGIVAQTLKTVANDCKFIHTTTVPASAVDITSALECSADAAGTSYTINTTVGGVMVATTAGTVATSTCVEFLAPAGTIGFNAVGTFDAGDSIVFYIKYKPLISGARVTASP